MSCCAARSDGKPATPARQAQLTPATSWPARISGLVISAITAQTLSARVRPTIRTDHYRTPAACTAAAYRMDGLALEWGPGRPGGASRRRARQVREHRSVWRLDAAPGALCQTREWLFQPVESRGFGQRVGAARSRRIRARSAPHWRVGPLPPVRDVSRVRLERRRDVERLRLSTGFGALPGAGISSARLTTPWQPLRGDFETRPVVGSLQSPGGR